MRRAYTLLVICSLAQSATRRARLIESVVPLQNAIPPRSWRGLALFFALAILALRASFAHSALELSAEERDFINKRVYVVGLSQQAWEPIDIPGAQGSYSGISADYLSIIARETGMKFRIQYESDFTAVAEKIARGEIDLAPSVARTAERERLLRFSVPYIKSPTVYIARRDAALFDINGRLDGLKVATSRSWPIADLLPRIHPGAQGVLFESPMLALQAVDNKSVDLFVGTLPNTVYTAEKYAFVNLEVRGQRGLGLGDLSFAMRRDNKVLNGIVDKVLNRVDPTEHTNIAARWQPIRLNLGERAHPWALNDTQTEYLRALGKIRVGYFEGLPPFTQTGKDALPHGMAVDYFNAVRDRLKLADVELVKVEFPNLPDLIVNRRIDIFMTFARNVERERHYDYIGPLLVMPQAIVNRANDDHLILTDQLHGKRLSAATNGVHAQRFRAKFPGSPLILATSPLENFRLIADGQSDATIESLPVAAMMLATQFPGKLKINAVVPDAPLAVYIGVTKNRPELSALVSAAFNNISAEEHTAIRTRWLTYEIKQVIDWRKILRTVGPVFAAAAIAFALLLFFNRRLRRMSAERTRLAEQYARARDEAHAMELSKTKLLSSVSHEVRSPLSAVIGLLELLKKNSLSEKQGRYVALAQSAARDQLDVLNEILDYVRAESSGIALDPQPFDVIALSNDVVEAHRPGAEQKGLKLNIIVADGVDRTYVGDSKRVAQALTYIVRNAIKLTKSGHVDIILEQAPAAPQSALRWTVRDTSVGMSEADKERLLKPFGRDDQTPNRRYGGQGVGIALSRALAHQMRGQLTLESSIGDGTVVELTLPLSKSTATEFGEQRPQTASDTKRASPMTIQPLLGARDLRTRRARVLLVDNDATLLMAMTELLGGFGYSVTAVNDGRGALATWESDRHEVLLTDWHMPGFDGFDLIQALRARESGETERRGPTKIVVMTADITLQSIEDLHLDGVDELLPKPIDMGRLRTILDSVQPANRKESERV